MNILSIEKARNELLSFLENTGSKRLKAKRICEFFAILIEQKSFSLIESYVLEFIPKYLDCLKDFSPFGASPEFTHNIIQLNNKLIETNATAEYKARLTQLNYEIQTKLHSLNKILAGEQSEFQYDRKAFFPLIEAEQDKSIDQTVGAIDSITIKVSKGKQKDKFIVVPSENESDKQLEEQINVSWIKAKEFCKKYVRKISPQHEVIISFDGNLGVYRGESLGAALTIAMIEEMLKHYNSQTVLQPISNVAFTGGISEGGKVNKVSKEIVEKKVEIAFYSNCQTLAVPKEDETFALYKLDELRKLYPARNLKIVGVQDVNEILLRRDLVEIKKQKLVIRTAKFVKKNWVSAVVTVLLAILFGYLFVVDWDDNPAFVTLDGQLLQVKNNNGKVLWTKKTGIDFNKIENENLVEVLYRLEDINNDERKELILCNEFFDQKIDTFHPGRIVCFNYKGHQMWQYVFQDSVISKGELQPSMFASFLIDIRTEHNIKVLYSIATSPYYSSAVFKLNSMNGKRIAGTLWNAGHFQDGIIGDFNNDGNSELVLTAINNGYARSEIVSIDLSNLNGQLPTGHNYAFQGIGMAKYNKMVLLPKSDYAEYMNARFNPVLKGGLSFNNKEFTLCTIEDIDANSRTSLNYRFDVNLNFNDVECSDVFQVKRDSLVAQNKLSKPFTNTIEYENILRSEIVVK